MSSESSKRQPDSATAEVRAVGAGFVSPALQRGVGETGNLSGVPQGRRPAAPSRLPSTARTLLAPAETASVALLRAPPRQVADPPHPRRRTQPGTKVLYPRRVAGVQ